MNEKQKVIICNIYIKYICYITQLTKPKNPEI